MLRVPLMLLVASLIGGSAAWGSWAAISMDDLAGDSDAIVVGRLKDMRIVGSKSGPRHGSAASPPGTMRADDEFTIFRGTIHVDRMLWSRRPAARRLVVEWASWNGRRPNVDHRDIAGKSVLWLLERDAKAGREFVYRADYPTRTIVLEDADDVNSARLELSTVARPGPRVRAMKRLLTEAAAGRFGARAHL